MNIDIRSAQEDHQSVFGNLWEFYTYDFSVMNTDLDVGESGRFGDPPLHYWSDSRLHPYLIYVNEKPSGFVLVNQRKSRTSIGQFFVMRKYRKCGVGKYAAFFAFDRFPGLWTVGVTDTNTGAKVFWRNIIRDYTQGQFEEHIDETGIDFLFENHS